MTRAEMINQMIDRHYSACASTGVAPESVHRLQEELALMPDSDLIEMLTPVPQDVSREVRLYDQYRGRLELEA